MLRSLRGFATCWGNLAGCEGGAMTAFQCLCCTLFTMLHMLLQVVILHVVAKLHGKVAFLYITLKCQVALPLGVLHSVSVGTLWAMNMV